MRHRDDFFPVAVRARYEFKKLHQPRVALRRALTAAGDLPAALPSDERVWRERAQIRAWQSLQVAQVSLAQSRVERDVDAERVGDSSRRVARAGEIARVHGDGVAMDSRHDWCGSSNLRDAVGIQRRFEIELALDAVFGVKDGLSVTHEDDGGGHVARASRGVGGTREQDAFSNCFFGLDVSFRLVCCAFQLASKEFFIVCLV